MTNPVAEIVNVVEKRDSLGRRNNGYVKRKDTGNIKYGIRYGLRIDKSMFERLERKANRTSIAELIRTYIEWGLENEE